MDKRLTKVEFTNLEKIMFPQLKITKAQVIEYYIKIAPKMLSLLANRPIVLTRYPNGIDKLGFYEKNAPEGTPPWVKTVRIYSKTVERNVDYIVCNDVDTLIWLANLAAIEIHMPLSIVDYREKPDFILFDIDPEPPASFKDAATVGLALKEKLGQFGVESYAKTSGKKGLHVLVSILREHSFRETREFARKIGQQLSKEHEIVTAEFAETKKPGKVFVDYLQNAQGRTMASPYSLRVTPEATVSTPVEWSEVKKGIKPSDFNIFSVLKRDKDPWKGILENRQKLEVT